jgi:predicted phage terminase large subunit-like protein
MQAAVNSKKLQYWQERVRWVMATDFNPHAAGQRAARTARAQKDYAFFVQTYFPHLATKKCARFHLDAANYLHRHDSSRALFEWARGHAKSSHISLLIPLWLKIQSPRQLNVMVLVSKSYDAAERLLADMQAELQYNELFNADFGRQVKDGSWTDGEFHTADGCMFVALGRGQSPRGLKDRGQRPDYIVIDDIDDDEMARNPKRVSDTLDWCLTALAGTMAMGRGRFVMVGNRIAKDSVLSRMAERPGILHTVVNALDRNGKPAWSENYTAAEIQQIRQFIGERRFQKEYMNNPINEGAVFLQKYMRYAKMLPDLRHYKSLVCYTDPSFKDSARADFKATMLAGRTPAGEFHILKAYAGQCSVSAMIGWHYDISKYVAGRVPVLYYMESNFLQDLLLDEFKKTGRSLGVHIPIRGDTRRKPDKFARIEALQPLFERGLAVFNEAERNAPGMRILEEQLLMFEKGSRTNDDAPDALEGAIWMLSHRNRTSDAPYLTENRLSYKW